MNDSEANARTVDAAITYVANGSFVNLIADRDVPAAQVVSDPFEAAQTAPVRVKAPAELFAPARENSSGFDLTDPVAVEKLLAERQAFANATKLWSAASVAQVHGETGEHFRPKRRLALHDWHSRQGAVFVKLGLWLRPLVYSPSRDTSWAPVLAEARAGCP